MTENSQKAHHKVWTITLKGHTIKYDSKTLKGHTIKHGPKLLNEHSTKYDPYLWRAHHKIWPITLKVHNICIVYLLLLYPKGHTTKVSTTSNGTFMSFTLSYLTKTLSQNWFILWQCTRKWDAISVSLHCLHQGSLVSGISNNFFFCVKWN